MHGARDFPAGSRRALRSQQGFGSDTSTFIARLKQEAFNNRLNLTSVTGNTGATASAIGPSPATLDSLTRARLTAASTTTKGKTSPGLVDIISSVGKAAGGIGAGFTGYDAVFPNK